MPGCDPVLGMIFFLLEYFMAQQPGSCSPSPAVATHLQADSLTPQNPSASSGD
jgi:hypothetical protein